MQVIKAHGKRINDLAFSPDGRLIASGGADNTVRVTDTHTGSCEVVVPVPRGNSAEWKRVLFNEDGGRLLCRSATGLQVWDVAARKRVAKLLSPRGAAYGGGLALSPTQHIAVANEWRPRANRSLIHFWDTRTWEERVPFETRGPVYAGLAFDPTGTRLATSLGVLDVTTEERVSEAGFYAERLEWSPTGHVVVWALVSNFLFVADAATGRQVTQLELGQKCVQDCAFSPDGRFVAAVSNEAVVRVWDTETWQERHQFAWGIGKLKCVCFAPDGLRAACGSESGRILIWDWDL